MRSILAVLCLALVGGCDVRTPTDREVILRARGGYVPRVRVAIGPRDVSGWPTSATALTADRNASWILSPGGHDWLRGLDLREDVDTPPSFTLQLTRRIDEIGLGPGLLDSYANKRTGSYSALLDIGKRVVVEVEIDAPFANQSAGEWIQIADGIVDRITWASDPITVECRSRPSGIAQTALLEDEWVYAAGTSTTPLRAWGWQAGVDLDTERGGEIDYGVPTEANGYVYSLTTRGTTGSSEPVWPAEGSVTDGTCTWSVLSGSQWNGIYLTKLADQLAAEAGVTIGGTGPEWAVLPYRQDRQSVWDALRAAVLQSGYDLLVRHGVTLSGQVQDQIQFASPPRTTAGVGDVDMTFSDSQYRDLTELSVSGEDIRNVVRVIYSARDQALRDSVDYPRESITVEDSTSIAAYGRRFAELCEASTSQIDSSTEADTLADAVLADLKDPPVSYSVEVPLSPWLELGDCVALEPDGVRFDSTIYGWVTALEHRLAEAAGSTKITLRAVGGAGSRRSWLERIARPGAGRPKKRTLDAGVSGIAVVDVGDALKINFTWPATGTAARLFADTATGFSAGRQSFLAEASKSAGGLGVAGETITGLFALSATSVWACGSFGSVYHWDGARWNSIPSEAYVLNAIWASADDDVWVAGTDSTGITPKIRHWDGVTWTTSYTGSGYGYKSIFGFAADDIWAGSLGEVLHWDGDTWTQVDTIAALGIWGVATDDVWCVGNDHTYHWNGSALSEVTGITSGDGLQAVFGFATDDVWTVGYASGVGVSYHWNGSAWASVAVPNGTGSLYAVSGGATDDVWAGGGLSLIHWTGSAWASSNFGPYPDQVSTLAAASTSAVWLGGWQTLLKRGSDGFWSASLLGADYFLVPKSSLPAALPTTSYYRAALYDQWLQQIAFSAEFSYP